MAGLSEGELLRRRAIKNTAMLTDLFTVTCPSCGEPFSVALPAPDEVPCEMDYDCEVCCHPLVIRVFEEGGVLRAEAMGLAD